MELLIIYMMKKNEMMIIYLMKKIINKIGDKLYNFYKENNF